MSRESTPRHAQKAGDLGFAVQFNAETPQSKNRKGNTIHPPSGTQYQTLYCRLFKATRPTPAPALMRLPH